MQYTSGNPLLTVAVTPQRALLLEQPVLGETGRGRSPCQCYDLQTPQRLPRKYVCTYSEQEEGVKYDIHTLISCFSTVQHTVGTDEAMGRGPTADGFASRPTRRIPIRYTILSNQCIHAGVTDFNARAPVNQIQSNTKQPEREHTVTTTLYTALSKISNKNRKILIQV